MLAGLILVLSSQTLFAGPTFYRSRTAEGTPVFADAPMKNGKIVRWRYKNTAGKAMATASCRGMTESRLNSRSGLLAAEMAKAAEKYQLNAQLIKAIARVESCFDKLAVSTAGAQGLMQLIPATAHELGVSNAFDVAENLDGGANYIAQMLKRYNHNIRLALAAYNAGPGAVDRHHGVPPFKETQRYVKQVLHHYNTYGGAKL